MASKRPKFASTQLSQPVADWGSEDEDFDLSQIDLSMTTETAADKPTVYAECLNEKGHKKAEPQGILT
jgi:hypothetical protein